MSDFIQDYRNILRTMHYSRSTEKVYVFHVRNFLKYNDYKSIEEINKDHVAPYLTMLATERKLSASSQNQALCAIIFMFKYQLGQEVGRYDFVWAKKRKSLPTVLTPEEVAGLMVFLRGEKRLIVQLLYGCGLRLGEALKLRVKDIDFTNGKIYIWDAKHNSSRVLDLPKSIIDPLKDHLVFVKRQHRDDISLGYGTVYLPDAIERKIPSAAYDWKWQYVFPAYRISKDPESGIERRHHIYSSGIQRAIKSASVKAEIQKRVTSHAFRHSYATFLVKKGVPISKVSKLLGHKDIKTTEKYIHLAGLDVPNPIDDLELIGRNIKHTRCINI